MRSVIRPVLVGLAAVGLSVAGAASASACDHDHDHDGKDIRIHKEIEKTNIEDSFNRVWVSNFSNNFNNNFNNTVVFGDLELD